jgi:transcriptional regulator with XRE-family HTH domain
MVAGTDDPAVQRRRLRGELRNLRNEANLTQRQVAAALDWSTSKLIRIENGDQGISTTDLRALLDELNVSDPDRRAQLAEIARTARREPWSDFRDVLDAPYRRYLSFESSSSLLRNYEPQLVPGLLQTEEYARVVLSETYERDKKNIDRIWEARQRRQELHDRDDPPKMFFIIDETVVRREVGGRGVMRRQVERLKDWSGQPHISLRVLPFAAGAHPGMIGPMVVLEFPDPEDNDLVYLEGPEDGFTFRDELDVTTRYIETFYLLEDKALSEDATRNLLDARIDELSSKK